MAEGRRLDDDTVTENLQDYVQDRMETSTNLPEQAEAAHELEQAEEDLNRAQAGQLEPQRQASGMAPDAEEALEEHLAATENVRGAGQGDVPNAGAATATPAAVQDEARSSTTDRTDGHFGMGNIRS